MFGDRPHCSHVRATSGRTLPKVTASACVDVTDLIEFYGRSESSSGVQRVIEGVLPFLLEAGLQPIALDRSRGCLVAVDLGTLDAMGRLWDSRVERSQIAHAELRELAQRPALGVNRDSVIVFPGAVWISDAMMLAAWSARAQGGRSIFLLYDLTPVMEAGHTATVNMLFDRYLHLIARSTARVPAISRSSRADFEKWCTDHSLTPPGGQATGLPNAIDPTTCTKSDTSPWSRPFALMVGTIESRKNHLFALHAWRELIERHGADNVPDLLCVGRLGWHAEEFLTEFYATDGLAGKVHLLTSSVSDRALADFYQHALFTIYPSRYEGWGLPVSESLAFGKVVITARNSSLAEAGGELATYFTPGDLSDFVKQIETMGLNSDNRVNHERVIAEGRRQPITWSDVAGTLLQEVAMAREEQETPMPEAEVVLGREYVLSPQPEAPDGAHADKYVHYLVNDVRTPLLGQQRDPSDFMVTDRLLTGQFGAPQTWGLELRPHRQVRLAFVRPIDGNLTILLSTRSMPGRVQVSSVSPAGDGIEEVYLGSVLRVDLGDGRAGEAAIAYLTVMDASDSVEGFLGVRSLVVMASDDHELEATALRSSAQALRQELDFLTNTRSWKLTAPLRKRWGRSGS